jgi:hypothetical protein
MYPLYRCWRPTEFPSCLKVDQRASILSYRHTYTYTHMYTWVHCYDIYNSHTYVCTHLYIHIQTHTWQHEELNLIRGFFDKDWAARNTLEMSFKDKQTGHHDHDAHDRDDDDHEDEDSARILAKASKQRPHKFNQIAPL